MNENVNTAAVAQEPVEFDLRDMLATLFLRWKTLLICLLAGALVFGLYTLRSAPRTTTVNFVTEEDVFAARQSVSEERAESVERLYHRIQFYTDYLSSIEEEFNTLAGYGENQKDPIRLQEIFYVSSEIDNIGSYLSSSMLSEEDYERLREITSAEGAVASVYKLVSFSVYTGTAEAEALIPYDNDDRQYLFAVTVYGVSEGQCKEILTVAEHALQEKVAELHKVDESIKLKTVGRKLSLDTLKDVEDLQNQLWPYYKHADDALKLQKDKVNALPGAEKNYYDKLVAFDEGGMSVSSGGRSLKKWTVMGGLIGLFAGVVLVLWTYLFDGKVKTAGELEHSLRSMVLNRVCVKGKRNLFGWLAAGLIGKDGVDPVVKADMVAADLGVLIEKNGKKALYFLCDSGDANAAALAEQVKARLQEKAPSAVVSVGNPLSAAEELEKIGAAELCVVFAEVKKTKRSQLRQWLQICTRYRLPVAGSVAVQKCW